MSERIPIRTAAQLAMLDDAEIVEGYWDGFNGEAEPGDNRSLSYWHGWRDGASDKGFRPIDQAQRELCHDYLKGKRA